MQPSNLETCELNSCDLDLSRLERGPDTQADLYPVNPPRYPNQYSCKVIINFFIFLVTFLQQQAEPLTQALQSYLRNWALVHQNNYHTIGNWDDIEVGWTEMDDPGTEELVLEKPETPDEFQDEKMEGQSYGAFMKMYDSQWEESEECYW